ncbi:MAG: exodeoxyribonuclease VII small subunit [Planctomycetia bacterium]|nr:exodeoxyribonuclease VII small subunit [Planctomycetia bacterium]
MNPKNPASESKERSFEESFGRLEEVVRLLESGQSTLSESLQLYEEGVSLLKTCHGQLQNARRKVEILSGFDENGNPIMESLEEDERSIEEKSETRGR